eukprot:gb/GECH01002402.1/.p1 GENE.gb/GECH01002402.1/~~gb/GECH01002402.1/.p1  ORF type:complete len:344 (+),score=55.26 gb/GECH01002402.1/:1-1032(+)
MEAGDSALYIIIIVISVISIIFHIFCASLNFWFRKSIFNPLWFIRCCINIFGVLLSIGVLLSNKYLWEEGFGVTSLPALCRTWALLTSGISIPFYLSFTSLLLLFKQHFQGKNSGTQILLSSIVIAGPFILCLTTLLIVDSVIDSSSIVYSFFNDTTRVCRSSALSVSVFGVLVVVFLGLYVTGTFRLTNGIMNRAMRRRVMHTMVVVVVLLLISLGLRILAVLTDAFTSEGETVALFLINLIDLVSCGVVSFGYILKPVFDIARTSSLSSFSYPSKEKITPYVETAPDPSSSPSSSSFPAEPKSASPSSRLLHDNSRRDQSDPGNHEKTASVSNVQIVVDDL